MNSKVSNNSTNLKHSNPKNNQSKNTPKKKPALSNNEDLKSISIRGKEISTKSLESNKSEISDLNILSKNNGMSKIKTYEIKEEEKVSFLLNFELVKEKIKISVQ